MAALGRETRANRELRAAREELARLAVAEERLRIARDLHDLLGHTLSVIALKSELAAKLVEQRPAARARAELEDVQRVTRQALTEVREAVHGYRRLALRRRARRRARGARRGRDRLPRRAVRPPELPAEVENVLAWAVREATTNVVRHSGARACAITLSTRRRRRRAAGRRRRPAPPPPAPATAPAWPGSPSARAACDGTLEAGARPEGGFRLRLTVPLAAP